MPKRLIVAILWLAVFLSATTRSSSFRYVSKEKPIRSLAPNPESRDQAEDREHRRAERQQWKWNKITGISSAVAAVIAAIFAWQAVKAARDQTAIAETALIASNRPWVMLTHIEPVSLSSDDEAGVAFWVKMQVKNVGHSPAQNVSVSGKLLIFGFDSVPNQTMANVCREPRSGSLVIEGRVLFPDQPQNIDGEIATSFMIDGRKVWAARAARIKSAYTHSDPKRDQAWALATAQFPFHAPLELVGCINYQSSDNTVLFQTSFVFDVDIKPGSHSFPLLGGEWPVSLPPQYEPGEPNVVMAHPRLLQRVLQGDQVELGTPLYSTFAN